MERHTTSVEFEGAIDGRGSIRVPDEVLKHFPAGTRANVHVLLTGRRISSALRIRGVTEEEIRRIGSLQLESREQVVRFLLSEGTLKGRWIRTGAGRAGRGGGRR